VFCPTPPVPVPPVPPIPIEKNIVEDPTTKGNLLTAPADPPPPPPPLLDPPPAPPPPIALTKIDDTSTGKFIVPVPPVNT
jgi:hypothetical protein